MYAMRVPFLFFFSGGGPFGCPPRQSRSPLNTSCTSWFQHLSNSSCIRFSLLRVSADSTILSFCLQKSYAYPVGRSVFVLIVYGSSGILMAVLEAQEAQERALSCPRCAPRPGSEAAAPAQKLLRW